jgi:hypothetical protein
MGNLEKFLHSQHPVPEIIKIAIIHYQFETIHPFLDAVIYFCVVLNKVSRVGLSALLSHGMSVGACHTLRHEHSSLW